MKHEAMNVRRIIRAQRLLAEQGHAGDTLGALDELAALRKDAERYRWLRDMLAVEDVARLVDEYAQWSWCVTDPAESVKTDAAVDKAMAAHRAVGAA